MAKTTAIALQSEDALFLELSQLIDQSQQRVVLQANSAITMLFWQIGNHINQNILEDKAS